MPSDRLRRLHPSSLFFSFVSIVGRFLVPALVLTFLGRGDRFEFWFVVFGVPAVFGALIRYISLRYALGQDELVIREGILGRRERNIPYQRIQNIDTKQTVLHRALGVAEVIIQTASGIKPEAVLRVLKLEAVDDMRRRVFADRQPVAVAAAAASPIGTTMVPASTAAGAAGPGRELLRTELIELIRLGIISNRGLIPVAAAAGLAMQFGIMPDPDDMVRQARTAFGVSAWTTSLRIGAGLLVFATFVAAVRLLSIGWAVTSFYGFRLVRTADELRTAFGLFTRHAVTIPRHRIQLLQIQAPMLHRLFRRVVVRARTAGGAMQGSEAGPGRDLLSPIAEPGIIPGLLAEVQPGANPDEVDWRPVHPRARRRLLYRSLLAWLLPGFALTALFLPYCALVWPLVIVWAWVRARSESRYIAWGIVGEAIWFRSGFLGREIRIVRFSKIQTVALAQTPFDRRHGHASVRVDTANSGMGQHAIAIPFLERPVADELRARLVREAAGTEFHW